MKRFFYIVHLDNERGLRGGERQLLYLASYLREQNHGSAVVCRKQEALEREAAQRGIETIAAPYSGGWSALAAGRIGRKVAELAQGRRIVIHSHTSHTASLAYSLSRKLKAPWVAHRRVDFQIGRVLGRLKYKPAAAVVAVSDAIRAQLVAEGIPAAKTRTVRDCIPCTPKEERLARAAKMAPASADERAKIRETIAKRHAVDPKAFWIANMAALVPHKDQETLLRAFAQLDRPDTALFLIGEGPRRKALEKLADALGISLRVRFAGFQDNPIDWLSAMDVYAHSSWGEGMGSVLLEAMALEVPISATAAGGIPEVIEHAKTGLLSPPKDPVLFSINLGRLLDDAGLARRLAAQARARLSDFSLSRCGAQMEAIYEEVSRP